MSLERDALRAYVTQDDATKYDGLLEGMVAVYATHSLLKQRVVDLRLDLHSSIAAVKQKLYTHCGSNVGCMRLQLFDEDGGLVRVAAVSRRCIACMILRNGVSAVMRAVGGEGWRARSCSAALSVDFYERLFSKIPAGVRCVKCPTTPGHWGSTASAPA